MIGVYLITNLKTGKKYIGESINIERRWADHKRDLLENEHANYYLQKDFNIFGKKYFKFSVLQEIEPVNIAITQSRLLMLEAAYINKYLEEKEELYNIENTLSKVLSGNKDLQISKEIATKVVISNFLRFKYEFDDNKELFILKERDTLENIILRNSSIKSKQKAQKVANTIFEDLKNKELYHLYTYESVFDLYMYHKIKKRTIIELTDSGIDYVLNHYTFDDFLLRKKNNVNSNINYNKKLQVSSKINTCDKNRIQEVWHMLKDNNILPNDNRYNDFRDILIKMDLIIIDQNRNTCATSFALDNNYFIIYAYNSSKDKFQYYISNKGIDYIKKNILKDNK